VHFVDERVDAGPIIAQAACSIRQGDEENSLAQRVLKLEHMLFPWVMNRLASKDIKYNHSNVEFSEQAITEARKFNFSLPCNNQGA